MNTAAGIGAHDLCAMMCRNFCLMCEFAGEQGGMWVAASGGTLNVAAGIIGRAAGVPFEDALPLLKAMARERWGDTSSGAGFLGQSLPPHWEPKDCEWDVLTVAEAAARAAVELGIADQWEAPKCDDSEWDTPEWCYGDLFQVMVDVKRSHQKK